MQREPFNERFLEAIIINEFHIPDYFYVSNGVDPNSLSSSSNWQELRRSMARTREFMLRPTPGAPEGHLNLRDKLDVPVHSRVTSELSHHKKQIHLNAAECHDGAKIVAYTKLPSSMHPL